MKKTKITAAGLTFAAALAGGSAVASDGPGASLRWAAGRAPATGRGRHALGAAGRSGAVRDFAPVTRDSAPI